MVGQHYVAPHPNAFSVFQTYYGLGQQGYMLNLEPEEEVVAHYEQLSSLLLSHPAAR